MADPKTRVLLRDAVPFKKMLHFATDQNWFFQEQRLHNARQLVDIYTWLSSDLKTVVNYIVDEIRSQYYFVIEGPDAEEVASRVRMGLPVYTLEEIRQQVRTATERDDRIEALQRLGTITSVETNSTDYTLFEAAFTDPDPDIRAAAVIMVGYVEWPELKTRLEQIKADDTDERVRSAATRMLQAMRRTDAVRRKRVAQTKG